MSNYIKAMEVNNDPICTVEEKMKHTPGPWKADNWATGWTVSAPDSHYSVCHLEDCNNAEANAHLIAAAPDLLETAKALVIDLMTKCEPIEGSNHNFEKARMYVSHVLSHRIYAVQQAIAKAEGRE